MSSYMIRRLPLHKITYLVPPRTAWQVLRSAFDGIASLASDQEQRDSYLKYVRDDVIREHTIDGSSTALRLIANLALFQELENPVLKRYGFKAEEFLEGVTPALEQFHDIEQTIDNKLIQISNKLAAEDEALEQSFPATNNADDLASGLNDDERQVLTQFVEQEASYLSMWTTKANPQDDSSLKDQTPSQLRQVLHWDWQDCLVDQLRQMLSSDFLKWLQKAKTIDCMYRKLRGVEVTYEQESCVVENVSLVSARVMVTEPENQVNEVDYDSIANDELKVKDIHDDPRLSVAARIEVLYNMQRTVSVAISPGDEVLSNITEISTRIAILEGYLKGGDGMFRWRLSDARELDSPDEFPLV
jgi:hypothetical protein